MSMLQEEFDVWLSSKYSNPFWVRHHRFEKSVTGEIRVDNGVFRREEATILFRMLNSRDPFMRLNVEIRNMGEKPKPTSPPRNCHGHNAHISNHKNPKMTRQDVYFGVSLRVKDSSRDLVTSMTRS